MARTFSGEFLARALEAHQRPYLVLEIDWGTEETPNVVYYLDRESDSFQATGTRAPTVSPCLVVDWGVLGQTLREEHVGSVDAITIKLEDRAGEISTLLAASNKQQKTVKVWRMFDENDVVWSTHAALMFWGATKPHAYSETDNVVTMEIVDPARKLIGKYELLATRELFPNVPADYEGRMIPQCWGYTHRVEAICVDGPWATSTLEEASGVSLPGVQYYVNDHPDEIGAPIDTEILVNIGSNRIKGKFRLSSDKSRKPSRFQVTGLNSVNQELCTIIAVVNQGTSSAQAIFYPRDDTDPRATAIYNGTVYAAFTGSDGVFRVSHSSVGSYGDDGARACTLDRAPFRQYLRPGQTLKLCWQAANGTVDSAETSVGQKVLTVLRADLDPEDYAGSMPGVDYWGTDANLLSAAVDSSTSETEITITVEYPGEGDVDRVAQYDSLGPGTVVKFSWEHPNWNQVANQPLSPVNYPYVYVVNGTESRKIIKAEGYNESTKRFTLIGTTTLVEDGDGPAFTSDRWVGTLEDDRYRTVFGTDRDVTTLVFNRAPSLDGAPLNRVFVTLLGTTSPLYGFAETPGNMMLTMLRHPFLLNVDAALVNEASFQALDADVDLAGRVLGFAQTESRDALEFLQDVGRQMQTLVYFDQGKFAARVLKNESVAYAATFDETSILEDSLKREETDVEDLVTRLTANWQRSWAGDRVAPTKKVAVNPGAEEAFKINNVTIDLWVYQDPLWVARELAFWLERRSRLYWKVTFTTFGRALVLQPGDWIRLKYVDGTGRVIVPEWTLCEVLEVKDKAPTGLIDVVCRYPKFTF